MASSTTSSPFELQQSFSEAAEREFLEGLGRRVRESRNRRGMTRKMVARDADVSERHLAQIESGDGNVSVALLRRIALALNVSLAELFSSAPSDDQAVEKREVARILSRIPPHRLEEVLSRLVRDFGQEEKTRQNRIALIGLRGAGKSTLGNKLAEELNVPFIELDREIEKDTGMPLGEMISLYGQSGYRRTERRTLARVLKQHERAVISIGGGVVSEPETYDYLLANCYTVWLKAQPHEHMSRVIAQGDFRAMAGNDEAMEDLRRILAAREPLYRKADVSIDTSGESIDESFSKLRSGLRQLLNSDSQ